MLLCVSYKTKLSVKPIHIFREVGNLKPLTWASTVPICTSFAGVVLYSLNISKRFHETPPKLVLSKLVEVQARIRKL